MRGREPWRIQQWFPSSAAEVAFPACLVVVDAAAGGQAAAVLHACREGVCDFDMEGGDAVADAAVHVEVLKEEDGGLALSRMRVLRF